MNHSLLVDNYDSFTANLYHLLCNTGLTTVEVIKADRLKGISHENFSHIVISPGPGLPFDNPDMPEFIMNVAGKIPVFGVCLGMQAIAMIYGARLFNMQQPYHGRKALTSIVAADEKIFHGLKSGFSCGLYHSWAVDPSTLPQCLEVTAISDEGVIMALRHKNLDISGVQFHPESYMTPDGLLMMKNWLK